MFGAVLQPIGFFPSSSWDPKLNCRGQGRWAACVLLHILAAVFWGGGVVGGAGEGGHGFLSHSSPSVQSFAYALASCVPYCLCLYLFELLLSGSKIPLSWTGPTLVAWDVLMLRLALHIRHILRIRQFLGAHRKQTNEVHGTVFSPLSGERGTERIFGEISNTEHEGTGLV